MNPNKKLMLDNCSILPITDDPTRILIVQKGLDELMNHSQGVMYLLRRIVKMTVAPFLHQ